MIRLIFLLAFMFFSMAAIGLCDICEIYKWTSDDGQVNFTDDLSKVPEKYRDQIKRKEYRTSDKADTTAESQRTSHKESVVEESITEYKEEPKKELADEEKEKIDKELRGIWENMKKSLKKRKIK